MTAFPGQRQGDAEETLVHELVHLFVGASPGTRRWHGREFKATMRRAMREGYGISDVKLDGTFTATTPTPLSGSGPRGRRKGRRGFTPASSR